MLISNLLNMKFFTVGWASFDDYELQPNGDPEACKIRPPEATPHDPSTGTLSGQVSLPIDSFM